MKENTIKAVLTGAVSAVCVYLGQLMIPVMVLTAVMIIDYCSGLAKAWVTGCVSSRTGILGIVKKVGYLAIAAIGMVTDWLVKYGVQALGTETEVRFVFALPVIVWLIINECVSILENVSACGAPVPKFLLRAIGALKDKIEEEDNEDN